jgi:hypothetical protein
MNSKFNGDKTIGTAAVSMLTVASTYLASLKGFKTYIAGSTIIVGAAISYFTGELTLASACLTGLNGIVAILVKKLHIVTTPDGQTES